MTTMADEDVDFEVGEPVKEEAPQEFVPEYEGATPEAPYGFLANGQPRKRRPSKTGNVRRAPGKTGKKRGQTIDYGPPVEGLIKGAVAFLAMGGVKTGSVPLIADAVTWDSAAPNVGLATNMAAQSSPWLASILDKAMEVGPIGMLLAALLPPVAQTLVNHRVLAPGILGTVAPEKLIPNEMRSAGG